MNSKMLRENFTSVCHYCGVVFRSNKSTARFCCSAHRAAYSKRGSAVSPLVMDRRSSEHQNIDEVFAQFYAFSETLEERGRDGWSVGLAEETINERFGYYGPFPADTRLVVMGSYVIKKVRWAREEDDFLSLYYFVKPFTLLTEEERAVGALVHANDAEACGVLAYSRNDPRFHPIIDRYTGRPVKGRRKERTGSSD